jgi:hypothetical protein
MENGRFHELRLPAAERLAVPACLGVGVFCFMGWTEWVIAWLAGNKSQVVERLAVLGACVFGTLACVVCMKLELKFRMYMQALMDRRCGAGWIDLRIVREQNWDSLRTDLGNRAHSMRAIPRSAP